jgi:hypothetical protein
MEEMQAILLKKDGAVAGQDKLEFKEKLKGFRSPDNIKNRGDAITFAPTIARSQHKVAPAKHIELACKNIPNCKRRSQGLAFFLQMPLSVFSFNTSIATTSISIKADSLSIAFSVLVTMTTYSPPLLRSTTLQHQGATCREICQRLEAFMLIIPTTPPDTPAFFS